MIFIGEKDGVTYARYNNIVLEIDEPVALGEPVQAESEYTRVLLYDAATWTSLQLLARVTHDLAGV